MYETRYMIILHADGGIRMQALEHEDEPTLEQLQRIVGGHIEAILAKTGVLIGYDEAKIDCLPVNLAATELMRNNMFDCVCGDAVLLKEDGYNLKGFLLANAERIVDALIAGERGFGA